MPKTTLYTLNGSGGAFITVPVTIPCRYVEIREDESVTPQGLIYQLLNLDGITFGANLQVGTPASPEAPQIVLGNKLSDGNSKSPLLGMPAQTTGGSSIAADSLINIKSAGAGGGNKIRVTEFE